MARHVRDSRCHRNLGFVSGANPVPGHVDGLFGGTAVQILCTCTATQEAYSMTTRWLNRNRFQRASACLLDIQRLPQITGWYLSRQPIEQRRDLSHDS